MRSNYNLKRVFLSLLHVGVVGCLLFAIGPVAKAEPKKPGSEGQEFLQKHCYECHSGDKPKGEVDLTELRAEFSNKANRQEWLKVLEQLQAGTMPPKEKPFRGSLPPPANPPRPR